MGKKLNFVEGDKVNGVYFIRIVEFNTFFHKSKCEFLCPCGRIFKALLNNVIYKNIEVSCNKDNCNSKLRLKNFGGKSDENEIYKIYYNIKTRCYNPNSLRYYRYGGRGIKICNRWLEPELKGFLNFYNDIGKRPSKEYSLDRIENNGNYSCGKCEECIKNNWTSNCKWSTKKQQANNTIRSINITYNEETLSLTDWRKKFGISYTKIVRWIDTFGIEESFNFLKENNKIPLNEYRLKRNDYLSGKIKSNG